MDPAPNPDYIASNKGVNKSHDFCYIKNYMHVHVSGPVFTNILILRIRIFLEFFLENSKNKYFWYSLNSYS